MNTEHDQPITPYQKGDGFDRCAARGPGDRQCLLPSDHEYKGDNHNFGPRTKCRRAVRAAGLLGVNHVCKLDFDHDDEHLCKCGERWRT